MVGGQVCCLCQWRVPRSVELVTMRRALRCVFQRHGAACHFLCHSKNPPLAARQASLLLRDPLVAHPLDSHLFDGELFFGGTERSRCQKTCKHSWREAKLAVMLSRCCETHGVLSHIFGWREEWRGEEGFLLLVSVIRRRFMDVMSVLGCVFVMCLVACVSCCVVCGL